MSVRRVLIVDDQPGIRLLIREILELIEYEVREAASGAEALQVARTFAPQLIMLDMKMPGMSGLEIIRHLQAEAFPGNIIVMSAYSELESLQEARALGVTAHLDKPFDVGELCRIVAEIIDVN